MGSLTGNSKQKVTPVEKQIAKRENSTSTTDNSDTTKSPQNDHIVTANSMS